MDVYKLVIGFMNRFKGTIAFRLKAHSMVLQKHLNDDEKVLYVFAGQKNNNSIAMPNTFIVALTDKRLLFARKRLLFGYFLYSITPDMFNDLKVNSGLIWGKIKIDTVKEYSVISNVSKAALSDIETNITEYMLQEKKKYGMQGRDLK